MLNVAIIGFGNAGRRFFQAIDIVNVRKHVLEVKCVADSNTQKLFTLERGKYTLYENYQDMLLENIFDLIFISTNDNAHFGIFKFIVDSGISYRKIICEKPLVNSASEIKYLRDNFQPDLIIVHFVERYSDACLRLREYINNKRRQVKRVYFEWSKFRLNDPRPTVGVFSEITHPLDLALFLSNITSNANVENVSTWISRSDFHTGGLSRPDGITVTLNFENGPIISGSSSYLRSERTRKMEFILADEEGDATEIAVLEFDKPLWDYDYLKIYDITGSQGKLVKIYDLSSTPPEGNHHGLSKICKFIEWVVESIDYPDGMELANMEQGLFVQKIVLSMVEYNKKSEQKLFSKIHKVTLKTASDKLCGLIHKDEEN